jgi:hypothetical protein
MIAKLLSFLFLGILLALAYHLVLDIAYEHFFPIPLFILPIGTSLSLLFPHYYWRY